MMDFVWCTRMVLGALGVLAGSATVAAQTPDLFFVPGRNVNTIGPAPIGPNPALAGNPKHKQRNEDSCDVSPQSPLVVLCANNSAALGKVGTGSVLGEGVVFGKDAVALAEVMSPELRAAIPGDFGRAKAVAWYGILQAGIIWDTGNAGQARIIHVGST